MNILIENSILLNHEGPIVFKPFLQDISHYKYIHKNYKTNNNYYRDLFFQFKRHPLLLWKLEISCGSNAHILELITNLTHKGQGFGAITIGDIHYANDPCMIYQNGEFSGNFRKNNLRDNSFYRERSYVDIYRDQLTIKLNSSILNHGIFYQRGVGHDVKIDLLRSNININ